MTLHRLRALLVLLAAVAAAFALAPARSGVGATEGLPPAEALLVSAGQWALWLLAVYVVGVTAVASACVVFARPQRSRALLRCVPAVVRPLLAALLGIAVTAGPATAAPPPTPGTPDAGAIAHRFATADPFDWAAPPDAVAQIDAAARMVRGQPVLAAKSSVPRRAPPGPVGTHTVRAGDCLWSLAARDLAARHVGSRPADVAVAWRRWYALNRATIGPDPGLLRPGEVLRVPPPDQLVHPSTRMTRRHP